MKIEVNRDECIGCMTCVNLCPDCFEMKDGKSSVKECDTTKCDLEEICESCPVEAITIEEEI